MEQYDQYGNTHINIVLGPMQYLKRLCKALISCGVVRPNDHVILFQRNSAQILVESPAMARKRIVN